jgi:hypothetical protein
VTELKDEPITQDSANPPAPTTGLLTIAGRDNEPGRTVAILICAGAIATAGRVDRPLIAMLRTVPTIALTMWLLARASSTAAMTSDPEHSSRYLSPSWLLLSRLANSSEPRTQRSRATQFGR